MFRVACEKAEKGTGVFAVIEDRQPVEESRRYCRLKTACGLPSHYH